AAGSATGLFVLVAIVGALLVRRTAPRTRLLTAAASVVCAAILLPFLPRVMGRPQLYDSLWSDRGRLGGIRAAWTAPWPDVVFGRGLGVGTNTSVTLTPSVTVGARLDVGGHAFMTDSTATLLLYQTGILGAVAFYALLALAAWRHREARVF